MNQQDFENAFIAKLSGIVEYKNENEMWWEDNEHKVTIEFLNDSAFSAKVREYYKNGNIRWEYDYRNGKLHGKYIRWYENGNKQWEYDYQNGKLHGKYIRWYENGNKQWEYDYRNGKRHGKYICWFEDGNKGLEANYQNGKLIKSYR